MANKQDVSYVKIRVRMDAGSWRIIFIDRP